jgi:L-rhamnose mutarotase
MKYCIVSELKKDMVDKYIKYHKEIQKSEYKELLNIIKKSSVDEEVIFIYKNFVIVYFEAEDLNKSYDFQRKFEVTQKWDNLMKDFFDSKYEFSDADKLPILEKVFDLNEQIKEM